MERHRRLVLIAALAVLCFSVIAAQGVPKEIDMISAVGLDKTLPSGVQKSTYKGSPSYKFGSQVGDLIASNAFDQADALIHSHDFQVTANAKLDTSNKEAEHTLVSVSSKDGKLIFALSLTGESPGDHLKIKYTVRTSTVKYSDIPRNIRFNEWHKVVVRFQDEEKVFRIYIDGEVVAVDKFKSTFPAFPSDGQLRLAQAYFSFREGQPAITNRFLGELQDVKIMRGPECKGVSKLCKCLESGKKGCVMDGAFYSEGQRWNRDKCSNCRCTDGQAICIYTCKACQDGGNTYITGDTWKSSSNNCDDCTCDENGNKVCTSPTCAKPDCTGKSGDTVIPTGKCCAVCKEDQCKGTGKVYKPQGNTCPKTCQNFQTTQSCPLKEGCYCADDKVLENGACIPPANCGCTKDGKTFEAGAVYRRSSCEICFCALGMHCQKYC